MYCMLAYENGFEKITLFMNQVVQNNQHTRISVFYHSYVRITLKENTSLLLAILVLDANHWFVDMQTNIILWFVKSSDVPKLSTARTDCSMQVDTCKFIYTIH